MAAALLLVVEHRRPQVESQEQQDLVEEEAFQVLEAVEAGRQLLQQALRCEAMKPSQGSSAIHLAQNSDRGAPVVLLPDSDLLRDLQVAFLVFLPKLVEEAAALALQMKVWAECLAEEAELLAEQAWELAQAPPTESPSLAGSTTEAWHAMLSFLTSSTESFRLKLLA